jgi:hypothetical protein
MSDLSSCPVGTKPYWWLSEPLYAQPSGEKTSRCFVSRNFAAAYPCITHGLGDMGLATSKRQWFVKFNSAELARPAQRFPPNSAEFALSTAEVKQRHLQNKKTKTTMTSLPYYVRDRRQREEHNDSRRIQGP